MELLTEDIRAALPRINFWGRNPTVHVRYFTLDRQRLWYVTSGCQQGPDYYFHGFVIGDGAEWRTFTLAQLEGIDGVVRDTSFRPCRIADALRSGIAWPERRT